MGHSRREFLRQLAIAGSALAAPSLTLAGDSAAGNASARAARGGATGGPGRFVPDLEFTLRAAQARAELRPGSPTEVWKLEGRVDRGAASALGRVASGALGPTFHVRRGQKLRIVFDNDIPEPSIIHWHGLSTPAAMDGHPRFAVDPGGRFVYEFEVKSRAGTYWYHAHPDVRTGPQVYRGMAGLFIVHDDEDDRLALPRGEFDLALVIQDRVFDRDNQLVYSPAAMNGWLGDTVLINGGLGLEQRVATRPYRLRLLNASNSRIYRLAWENGAPLSVIGTDGGLLERPLELPYLMLGPGERAEIWADFAGLALGGKLALVSREFEAGGGMGMGMGTLAGVPHQGAPFVVTTFKADRKSSASEPLPKTLRPIERYSLADAANASSPRRIVPTMRMMRWGLNGRTFDMEEIASDERVKLGSLEVWEFDNTTMRGGMGRGAMRRGRGMGPRGMGMMMAMPHPMHLHGGQFQVIGRDGVTHGGYADGGWKDTVLVMPGERARVLMRHANPGLFLYHCHNLEHEDGGMMRNYLVEA